MNFFHRPVAVNYIHKTIYNRDELTPKTNPSTAFFDWNEASPSLRFSLSTSCLFESYIKGNKSQKNTNWFGCLVRFFHYFLQQMLLI
jgi:hypothetical protein